MVVEELKDGEKTDIPDGQIVASGSKIKTSKMASAVTSRKRKFIGGRTVVMCKALPQIMRIYLKRGVPWLSMVACLCYDMSLFLIFAVNITYHEDSELASTEFSLLISCLIFGCLFEIVGRKKVFTMRLCVTSCCSFMVAFAEKIWLPFEFLNFIREMPF